MSPDQIARSGADSRTKTAMLSGLCWMPSSGEAPRQLVVLCHGIASDGHQMAGLAAHWGHVLPDAAFIAPHAPFPYRRSRWSGWRGKASGREWFSLRKPSKIAQEAGVRIAAELLNAYVDEAAERLCVPQTAVAMTGFSQGAMVALFAGLRRPVPPASIVVFAGALLAPRTLPAELRSRAPVLLLPGDLDEVVPTSESLAAMQALSDCHVPVRLEQLAEANHMIHPAGMAISASFLQEAFT